MHHSLGIGPLRLGPKQTARDGRLGQPRPGEPPGGQREQQLAGDVLGKRRQLAGADVVAEELRGKAYFAGCSLEGQAKGHWSMEAVEQAKRRAGW